MEVSLIIPSFIAGLLMFLAPCTLPLIPAYLTTISNLKMPNLKEISKSERISVIRNGAMFILGFSSIFIAFGVLAGFVGSRLIEYQIWLSRVGGVFIILFGLTLLGVFKLGILTKQKKFKAPEFFEPGNPLQSFFVGASFGVGWTPCVGPTLGSVLFLASNSSTALSGGFLLAIFSLGLGVPFLVSAILVTRSYDFIVNNLKTFDIMQKIGALILIIFGLLLLTDNMSQLSAWSEDILMWLKLDWILDNI